MDAGYVFVVVTKTSDGLQKLNRMFFYPLHYTFLSSSSSHQNIHVNQQKKGLAGNRTRDHSQHRLRVFKDAVRRPP